MYYGRIKHKTEKYFKGVSMCHFNNLFKYGLFTNTVNSRNSQ